MIILILWVSIMIWIVGNYMFLFIWRWQIIDFICWLFHITKIHLIFGKTTANIKWITLINDWLLLKLNIRLRLFLCFLRVIFLLTFLRLCYLRILIHFFLFSILFSLWRHFHSYYGWFGFIFNRIRTNSFLWYLMIFRFTLRGYSLNFDRF